ncbi:MAG: hypothetical protein AAFX06_18380 [Planctomycetota bacterium]
MEIVVLAVVLVVLTLLSAAVLTTAVVLVGDEELTRDTILKCLGITVVVTLAGLMPVIGGLVGIVVWFVGLIVAFEKTFGEAFLIGVCCFVINIVIRLGLFAAAAAVMG